MEQKNSMAYGYKIKRRVHYPIMVIFPLIQCNKFVEGNQNS